MAYARHGRGHGYRPIRSAVVDVASVVLTCAALMTAGVVSYQLLEQLRLRWLDNAEPMAAGLLAAVIAAVVWFSCRRWVRRHDSYLARVGQRSMGLPTALGFDLAQTLLIGVSGLVVSVLAHTSGDAAVQIAGIVSPIAVTCCYLVLAWPRIGFRESDSGGIMPRGWWARTARVLVHWLAVPLSTLTLIPSGDPDPLPAVAAICFSVTIAASALTFSWWLRWRGDKVAPAGQTLDERWRVEQAERRNRADYRARRQER